MLKGYCYVYISEFQDTAKENNDWFGEEVTESIHLGLAHPPYYIRHERNHENASYDKLTFKEMHMVAVIVKEFL